MTPPISPQTSIRIRFVDAPDKELSSCTVAEFAEANDYGPDQTEALISDLQAGKPHMVGGGSAPLFQIERAG